MSKKQSVETSVCKTLIIRKQNDDDNNSFSIKSSNIAAEIVFKLKIFLSDIISEIF